MYKKLPVHTVISQQIFLFILGSVIHSPACEIWSKLLGSFYLHSFWTKVFSWRCECPIYTSGTILSIWRMKLNVIKKHIVLIFQYELFLYFLQSCSKPFTYAVGLNELGANEVHRYVGQEPSGRMFNELTLDFNSMYLKISN